jgi:hypothetical protein
MTTSLAISASLACFRRRALAGHCCDMNLAGCINSMSFDHAAGRDRIRWLTSVLKKDNECYCAAQNRSCAKEAPTIPIDQRPDPAVSSLEA